VVLSTAAVRRTKLDTALLTIAGKCKLSNLYVFSAWVGSLWGGRLEMYEQKASLRLFIKPFYALLPRNYHVFSTSIVTVFGEQSIEMWQLWTNEFRANHKSQIPPNDIVLSLQPQNHRCSLILLPACRRSLVWTCDDRCWHCAEGPVKRDVTCKYEAMFIVMELDTIGAAITNLWAMMRWLNAFR
jgi:hypothetical protein